MKFSGVGIVCIGLLMLAGCSIKPLPERDGVVRHSTYDIVTKVRCEARQAIIDHLVELLAASKVSAVRSVVPRIQQKSMTIKELNARYSCLLEKDFRNYVDKFRNAGMAFKFTFTISETNNGVGEASLRLPFTNGTFNLGLKAGAEKTRANERIVEISESFSQLLLDEDTEKQCNKIEIPDRNWTYPITGNIGLNEAVKTFIGLVNSSENEVTFSDELTFTTRLLGQVSPSVGLTDIVPRQLRLASAKVDVNADRKDVHKLKLVITDVRKEPVRGSRKIRLADGVTLQIADKDTPGAVNKCPAVRSGKTIGRLFSNDRGVNRLIAQDAMQKLRDSEAFGEQQKIKRLVE